MNPVGRRYEPHPCFPSLRPTGLLQSVRQDAISISFGRSRHHDEPVELPDLSPHARQCGAALEAGSRWKEACDEDPSCPALPGQCMRTLGPAGGGRKTSDEIMKEGGHRQVAAREQARPGHIPWRMLTESKAVPPPDGVLPLLRSGLFQTEQPYSFRALQGNGHLVNPFEFSDRLRNRFPRTFQ